MEIVAAYAWLWLILFSFSVFALVAAFAVDDSAGRWSWKLFGAWLAAMSSGTLLGLSVIFNLALCLSKIAAR